MPTEIISGIWIGNVDCSFDNNFLKDNNISILINCTINYGFPDINVKKLNFKLVGLPLVDDLLEALR